MARKDLVKHKLPEEYKAVVLELLERTGGIANPRMFAREILGVDPRALKGFLQTNRAMAAASRATEHTRRSMRLDIQQSDCDSSALLPHGTPEGVHQIEEVVPDSLCSAYRLHTKKRNTHD